MVLDLGIEFFVYANIILLKLVELCKIDKLPMEDSIIRILERKDHHLDSNR
jgi:hypothetical protein